MPKVAVAVAALLLAVGCAGHTSTGGGPPRSNEKVLTLAQSERLVRWAGSLRSCLHQRGFPTGTVKLARTRIELAVPQGTEFHALLRAGVKCGDALGGPPTASSLQTFARRIVLYLPKRCLLDPDVHPSPDGAMVPEAARPRLLDSVQSV
jgi:hypothetical protein